MLTTCSYTRVTAFVCVVPLQLYGVSRKLLGARFTNLLLKKTVAGQFLGGFSEDEAKVVAKINAANHMSTAWNYSIEQDLRYKW